MQQAKCSSHERSVTFTLFPFICSIAFFSSPVPVRSRCLFGSALTMPGDRFTFQLWSQYQTQIRVIDTGDLTLFCIRQEGISTVWKWNSFI